MSKQWEVNHIGKPVTCPCCGHTFGIIGTSEDKPKEAPPHAPPCQDLAVTDGDVLPFTEGVRDPASQDTGSQVEGGGNE